jgi:hypothetical protein
MAGNETEQKKRLTRGDAFDIMHAEMQAEADKVGHGQFQFPAGDRPVMLVNVVDNYMKQIELIIYDEGQKQKVIRYRAT